MNHEFKITELFEKIVDLLIVNALFLFTSIPLITIGASTTALYSVTLKLVKNEESYIVKSYFKSFKQNFIPATKGFLLLGVPSILMTINLFISIGQEKTLFAIVFFLSCIFLSLFGTYILYFFPILARFNFTVKQILLYIPHMILSRPFLFLLLIFMILPFFILGVYSIHTSLALLIFLLTIGFALITYVQSLIFRKIFQKYESQ